MSIILSQEQLASLSYLILGVLVLITILLLFVVLWSYLLVWITSVLKANNIAHECTIIPDPLRHYPPTYKPNNTPPESLGDDRSTSGPSASRPILD